MTTIELTDEEHAVLLLALGMAMAVAGTQHRDSIAFNIRKLVGIVAPTHWAALPRDAVFQPEQPS